ncbi:MAG: hypothetical protein KAQ68_02605 [Clostridiales bacterium]|nr:hypothetical protein [Clostridiales bacterium]
MKKIIYSIIVVIIVVFFAGCVDVEITCRITQDNYVQMSFLVDASTYGMSNNDRTLLNKTFENLAQYWKTKGLSVKVDNYKNNIIISANMNKQTSNPQEAFDSLLSFMMSEVSPFVKVEGGYNPSFFTDKRYLSAEIDLSNLVDMEYIESLPTTQEDRINLLLEQVKGKVIFDMPGEVLDYVGNIESSSIHENISLDESVKLSMTTEYENADNVDEYNDLNRQILQQKDEINSLIIIMSVLLASIISIIIIVLLQKRKQTKA